VCAEGLTGHGGPEMAEAKYFRNPVKWARKQSGVGPAVGALFARLLLRNVETRHLLLPTVRRIQVADLREILVKGLDDFEACQSDVILLCLVFPLLGIALAWLTYGLNILPLLFPLASGFALVGPVLAVSLYEMSRRREQGAPVDLMDAFGVVRSPGFGAILVLGLALLAIFLLWLLAAHEIYRLILGPEPPISVAAFIRDVFTTNAGWLMIAVGFCVGFFFAVLVLTISVVSFPLLLDRDVGLYRAVVTSARAVAMNPGTMALWGLIVASSLAIGSIPGFIGLLVVMPMLGHATWHLYRKVVE
jgi:uncharacterized membrane protein